MRTTACSAPDELRAASVSGRRRSRRLAMPRAASLLIVAPARPPSSRRRPRAGRARARCATGSAPASSRSARWRAPPRGSGSSSASVGARGRRARGPARRGPGRARRRRRPARLDREPPRRGAPARRPRLRKRLAEVRAKLSGLLRERYMGGRPDFVTVVLHADGFPQLLETLQFVRRVERADTRAARTSSAPPAATPAASAPCSSRSTKRRDREADAVRARRDALAAITAGPARAPGAARPRARRPRWPRSAAPAAAAASAERELTALLAARARAAARVVGPGGPWAIPWPIVQCESGGQNLAAQLRRRLRLLPVHGRDLEGPRRLDPAGLPGLQGRAGPARGEAVGGRRGARQLGLCLARGRLDLPDWAARLLEEIPVAHLGPARRGRRAARPAGHVRPRRRRDRQRDRRQAQARHARAHRAAARAPPRRAHGRPLRRRLDPARVGAGARRRHDRARRRRPSLAALTAPLSGVPRRSRREGRC